MVVVMDLFRPDTQLALDQLVDQYAANDLKVLQVDFAHSLQAAWRVDEVNSQLQQCGLQHCHAEIISDRHLAVVGVLS